MKKLGQQRQFIYQSCVKKSRIYHVPAAQINYVSGRKSFCFSAKSNQRYTKVSQRLYLAQTLIKNTKTRLL